MREGPPFEKYPASPTRDGVSYRVISPRRDALVSVSIAGRLAITRYLVRGDSGWREVAASNDVVIGSDGTAWALAWRDPIEAEFRAQYAGGEVRSRVTVTGLRCEIRVGITRIAPEDMLAAVALSPNATMTWTEPDVLVILLGHTESG